MCVCVCVCVCARAYDVTEESLNLNEVIPLCIYIFTLLLYIAVNTTILEYNTNATCFDLQ